MNKEYLDKLKEEDYIAWSELTGDPVTGLHNDEYEGCGCIITIILITAGTLVYILFF